MHSKPVGGMSGAGARWIRAAGVAGCLLFALGLRFGDLEADPPPGLSVSAGAYFDGLGNAHGARSLILFGRFRPDEWDPFLYSPLTALGMAPWFRLFGTGVAATNAYGALFSMLLVLAGAAALRREGRADRSVAGWLGLLFFTQSFLLTQFGRTALFENPMMLAMTAAALCLGGREAGPREAFAAAGFGLLAYVTKAISIYFLPALAAGILVAALRRTGPPGGGRAALRILAAAAAGAALVLVPWWVFFRMPNAAEIGRIGTMWKAMCMPSTAGRALANAARSMVFFWISSRDMTLMLSLCVAAWILYRAAADVRSVSPLSVLFTLWLGGGIAAIAILDYSAPRYYLPILPAVYGLCAIGLARVLRLRAIPARWRHPWRVDLLCVGLLTVFVRFVMSYRIPMDILLPGRWPPVWERLALSAAAAAAGWLAVRLALRVWGRPLPLPLWIRTVFVAGFALHFLYGNLKGNLGWWLRREYTIVETSRALRAPERRVIGGAAAGVAVAETGHVAVRIGKGGWYNELDPFRRYGLTHLFLTTFAGETARFRRFYPSEMASARLLDTFDVCGYRFEFYELPAPGPGESGGDSAGSGEETRE